MSYLLLGVCLGFAPGLLMGFRFGWRLRKKIVLESCSMEEIHGWVRRRPYRERPPTAIS